MDDRVQNHESGSSGHQPDRVQVRTVLLVGGGLALLVVASMLGMAAFQRRLAREPAPPIPYFPGEQVEVQPPAPRLDPNQSKHLEELRREHQQILTNYAWIDEAAGVARIPIERAMEITVDQLSDRAGGEED